MTNAELTKALRYCGNFEDREGCDEECPYFNDKDCPKRIMCDAADALEAAEKRTAIVEEERDLERFAAKNYLDKIDELKARLPKEGEWIRIDEYIYGEPWECSNCETTNSCRSRYCPDCGAKMKGANDEQIH